MTTTLIPQEVIEERIFFIRGQKVMIDRDLAELYGVETKYLNRQVKRNIERFPDDFMFQLTTEEKKELVTNCHRFRTLKHSATLPYAFTEHGVAMLASVLNSERAVKISILIIKTFVRLHKLLSVHKEFAQRLTQLEQEVGKHDSKIKAILKIIHKLVAPSEKPIGKIVFTVNKNGN